MRSGKMIRLVALCMCIWILLHPHAGNAQPSRNPGGILFYQLNTSHGLSDNYIFDMTVDKSGNLWIATGDGLNMFNGKTVVKFFQRDYPQLQNDFPRQLICDQQNRIWVLTERGNLTIIDERRSFHRVGLYNDSAFIPTRRLLYSASLGPIIFTRQGHYLLNKEKKFAKNDSLSLKDFTPLVIRGFDTMYKRGYRWVEPFDAESHILVLNDGFFKVNHGAGFVEKKYTAPNIRFLTAWSDHEALIYDLTAKKIQVFDLRTETHTELFANIRDQHGEGITDNVTNAKKISPTQLLITTTRHGMYLYDLSSHTLVHHRHDPSDPATLSNNSPNIVATDSTGWVFIGATPNGISYYKNNAVIGQQSIFQDRKGNIYDGYTATIATLDNDTYFIGVSDNLLQWKRSTNTTRFMTEEPGLEQIRINGCHYVAFDSRRRLWASTPNGGVFVLDENKHLLKHLDSDTANPKTLPGSSMRHMGMGPDGYMWLSTRAGICRVNLQTFETDRLENSPLYELKNILIHRTWFFNDHILWIATEGSGAWQYDFNTRKFIKYTTKTGLASDDVLCINKDNLGNIYIGSVEGLDILFTNGKIKHIGTEQGLLNKRVEALLLDKNGRIWIGNDVGLACFSIADSSIRVFDERYGLSVQGFRINAYHQNSDDELVWGTERGLQYFYPDNLLQQKVSLPTMITRVETRDVITDLAQSMVFDLAPQDNYVTFYFSSIDYSKHLRTFYEYKLEGIDDDWIRVVDQNFVRYSSLPSGTYVFKVRASNDGAVWDAASNTVTIRIAKPLWSRTWFRLLGIALGCLLIWYVISFYRKKQISKQQELETEVVINYFASRINSLQQTDEILWDVAKNCISKLHFEDCVIYLLDKERNILVQKAAWGPKLERDFTIYQPIEIPVGKGIVGAVAETAKAILIGNTDTDERYIADDAKRNSELAVPLIIDGTVIGVIDSEHSKKNFFNQEHLNILSTVAVLCANQIQRAKAEKEKQKATIEALENKQKVTESRLQSLRLQMNPHFLFNALNSIQQMILANEEMVATRYLSRFSKLLRTILVHSDKEMVTLKEELETLHLYIELESVRFKESFKYKIECDEEIDKEEVKVPTLLMQPFVENAIWHGLMHKEGDRQLHIRFFENNDRLTCVIEDNGIGREKSKEVKTANGKAKDHVSKGIQVSVERLKSMKDENGETGNLNIIDLVDDKGEPCGTRIEISFPIQN
jgi:ligand-binding sensor domain-containing protein/putative methionine-R-sulfoxide reductase with GAF domain/anti-sigma regulatory factor (Ser/Thr protein kinase)